MDNLGNYFLKRLAPYDQKIKSLTQSLKNKDSEISVLELAYKDLLLELQSLVDPKQYAEFLKTDSLTSSNVDELTSEEQLIMIKTFNFNVPIPESDTDAIKKLKAFQELVQVTDFRNMKKKSAFQTLVNSPEFDLFIYSPDFGIAAGNHDLMAVIKSVSFKNLAGSGNYKNILASNGLKLPLNPFDEQLAFKLSLLKSLARKDALLEDWKVKRQSSLSPSSRDFNLNFVESPMTAKLTPNKNIRTELSFSTAVGSPANPRMLNRKKSSGLLIEKKVIAIPFK